MSPRIPVLILAALSVFASTACSVETVEPSPSAPAAPAGEVAGDTDANAPAEDEDADRKASEEPGATTETIPRVVLSGTFSKVSVNYKRVTQYMVLTLRGDSPPLSSDASAVKASSIDVAETTEYELLYPTKGACDTLPKLTIARGAVHLELDRAGEPGGTMTDCHFLARFINASDGGFQARLENVSLDGGATVIEELLLDVKGPPS
ncbi:MAG: hypothetical protein KF850_04785 [Labilithrix sp.]|nr:hypothetical protein [Labilithrix sp.]